MEPVIAVQNLGKKYILRHQSKERYTTLRDVLEKKAKNIFSSKNSNGKKNSEEFWALKNVSFEIMQGDRVGIIGRNGAGKSTLLKILSRITDPTTGKAIINGRIASLLEVGTGFHPELTGRENIFLNGSILGMSKQEIKNKFDEIVAFAETEKFLDTPVKRYSSGMYVRLAFSVAAHLQPEILIVDEVLAVGDAEFQKKCIGKMKDVSGEGRTVLFVSHNMAAIQNLCDKAILLTDGKVEMVDETAKVISKYLSVGSSINSIPVNLRTDRQGNGALRFTGIAFIDNNTNKKISEIQCGSDVRFRLFFARKEPVLKNLSFAIGINDDHEQRICLLSNEMLNQKIDMGEGSPDFIDIVVKEFPLAPGKYNLTMFSSVQGETADWIQNAFYFDVCSGDFYGTGKELPGGQGNFLINYNFIL